MEISYNINMSMFDTIQCSDTMPFNDDMAALGLNVRNWSFQSKDLDNCMIEYVLQDGILYEKRYKETKWIEPEFINKKIWSFGHIERTGEYLEDIKYHGVVNMHDYRQDVMGKWDCWIEYGVTFTDGKVTKTELKEFTKEDNTPRLQKNKELWDDIILRESKWYNKHIFYTCAWFKVVHLKRKFINMLINWLTFINNFSLRFL